MGWLRLLPLGALAGACSGHTKRDAPATYEPADAGESGTAGSAGVGGMGGKGTTPDAGSSVAGEAGAASSLDPGPLVPSGTKVCEDERDCAGLDCMTMAGTQQSACVQNCSQTLPCRENELCVEHSGIIPSCLHRCEWPWDCSFEFDCLAALDDGAYVCVPAHWASAW